MGRNLALAGALAVVLLLSGCQALAEGPARLGGEDGELCVPVTDERTVLVGDVIGAPSGGDIVITGVELVDAAGVSLNGSWLLPFTPEEPPISSWTEAPSKLPAWSERADSIDSTVAAGDQKNLVVELKLDGTAEGTASAVAISYQYDDGTFRKLTTTSLVITDQSCG